jgi:hypothetical protein
MHLLVKKYLYAVFWSNRGAGPQESDRVDPRYLLTRLIQKSLVLLMLLIILIFQLLLFRTIKMQS